MSNEYLSLHVMRRSLSDLGHQPRLLSKKQVVALYSVQTGTRPIGLDGLDDEITVEETELPFIATQAERLMRI